MGVDKTRAQERLLLEHDTTTFAVNRLFKGKKTMVTWSHLGEFCNKKKCTSCQSIEISKVMNIIQN